MPEDPPLWKRTSIKEKFDEIFFAIDLCVRLRMITAALALMFSAIDVAAWAYSSIPPGEGVKKHHFVAFAQKYLLSKGTFECKALELYGARCGILHNFSSESNLSREGKVRQIIYAWGNSDIQVLREMNQRANMDGYVVERVEDLISALETGIDALFKDAEADAQLASRLSDREFKILGTVSNDDAAALLQWVREKLGS